MKERKFEEEEQGLKKRNRVSNQQRPEEECDNRPRIQDYWKKEIGFGGVRDGERRGGTFLRNRRRSLNFRKEIKDKDNNSEEGDVGNNAYLSFVRH
jgi:hypothetical protein